VPYLGLFGIVIMFFSLSYLLVYYMLSLSKTKAFYILLFFIILAILLYAYIAVVWSLRFMILAI